MAFSLAIVPQGDVKILNNRVVFIKMMVNLNDGIRKFDISKGKGL